MANRGNGATAAKVKDAAEIERALRPLRYPRYDPQPDNPYRIHPERIVILMLRAKYKLPSYCCGDRRLEDDDAPVDLDDLLF